MINSYTGKIYPDDYTGPLLLSSAQLGWSAYVNGDPLRATDMSGRRFKSRVAAQRAVDQALTKCLLCLAGFGHQNNMHRPSQRLGMISPTPCTAQPVRSRIV